MAPEKLPQRRSSSSVVSTVWDVSEQVLRTLTSVAQYVPTPILGRASVVALSIFEAVQGANENKDALKQLASVACNLVFIVSNTFKELHPLSKSLETDQQQPESEAFSADPVLNRHVDELVLTLSDIQAFITNQTSRPLLRRVVSSRSDLNIIQDYRDHLKQTLDAFQLQSLITIRETVSRMASRQESMNQEAARRHDSVRQTLSTIHEEFKKSNQRQSENRGPFTESPVASPTSSSPSSPFPSRSSTMNTLSLKSNNPFASLISRASSVQGNISVNHISGDYSIIEKVDKSTRENYNNVFHGNAVIVSSGRGRQEQEHSYGPSGNGFGYDPNTGLPGRGWARVRGRYIGASGAGPGRRRTMSEDGYDSHVYY